jgi:RNA polymerase sigma-70 factor (ECF subfamily)
VKDEDLMRLYCQGERRAFDELFSRYAGKVHGFLLRRVGQKALADDLLQKTWLRVHQARELYNPDEPFAPWLYTVANNIRRDSARAQMRDRAELTREGTLPEPAVEISAPASEDPTERVKQALDQLPDSYREVIVLHRWQELSFAEIAKILGSTEGAVKLRAHRGYLALRKALGVSSNEASASSKEERP